MCVAVIPRAALALLLASPLVASGAAAQAPASVPFDRGATLAALTQVRADVGTCSHTSRRDGQVHVAITFANDGSVAKLVSDGELRGTPEERCALEKLRVLRVPAYAGARVTVGWSATFAGRCSDEDAAADREAIERAVAGVDYSSCGRSPEQPLEATVRFSASPAGGTAFVSGPGVSMDLAGCIAARFRRAMPIVKCGYQGTREIVIAGDAIPEQPLDPSHGSLAVP